MCQPSKASTVWQTLDLSYPLGKSWRARLFHPPTAEDGEPNQPREWWQATAGRAVKSFFLANLRPTLSDAEGALFRSKGGPFASAPFVSFPMNRVLRLEPQNLRVLFFHRPLPLSSRLPMWPSSRRPWPSQVGVLWGRWDAECLCPRPGPRRRGPV